MRRHIVGSLILGSLAWTLAAGSAGARQAETTTLLDHSKNETVFVFSTDIPDSPALALSGIDASKTTSVGEVRKFVVSLPATFDGENQTALALDVSPAELLSPAKNALETLEDYRNAQYVERLLRRTKVSVVVRNGKDEGDPAKSTKSLLAAGLITSILDSSDPLLASLSPQVDRPCVIELDPLATRYLGGTVLTVELEQAFISLNDVNPQLAAIRRGDNTDSDDRKRADLLRLSRVVGEARATIQAYRANFAATFKDRVAPKEITTARPAMSGDIVRDAYALSDEIGQLLGLLNDSRNGYRLPNRESREAYNKGVEACETAIAQSLTVAPSLDIGVAALWRGDPSGLKDLDADGAALWLSYHQGWRMCGNRECTRDSPYLVWGLSARAAQDETVSTGDTDLKEAKSDNWQAWTGLEFYSKEWRAAARYGYGDTDFQDATAAQFSKAGDRWLLSADFAVGNTTWIGLSYGKAAGSIDALDGETFKVTLRFSEPSRYELFK